VQSDVVPFRVAEFKNEPFAIKQVMLGQRLLEKQDSLNLNDNWLQQLVINGKSQTPKEIAYISYGIDFDSAERDGFAYRLKLARGRSVFLASGGQAGDSLRLLQGDQFKINFNAEDWQKNGQIIQQVGKLRGKIAEVSIFVESVAFTDDTMWVLGSWLKRSASDSDRYDPIPMEKDKVGQFAPLPKNDRWASSWVPSKRAQSCTSGIGSSYQQFCCHVSGGSCNTINFEIISGGARPKTVTSVCNIGQYCFPPYACTKQTNSVGAC
jgi:hypothetical protein